jgi:exodeoxyribonuclease VII large subunit
LKFKEEKLAALIQTLEALGPLATLKRGFSVTLKLPEEKVITRATLLKKGELIKTRLSEGYLISQVKEVDN